jgi:hypothetical protein
MNLQRLRVLRHGQQVFAVDGNLQQTFPVVNPGHIPDGVEDGIFSIDYQNKTAQFESRKREPTFVWMTRENKDASKSTKSSLPDGTAVTYILGGDVLVTHKGNEVYVDGEHLPKDAARLLGALTLEGLDISSLEVAKALRYVLKR